MTNNDLELSFKSKHTKVCHPKNSKSSTVFFVICLRKTLEWDTGHRMIEAVPISEAILPESTLRTRTHGDMMLIFLVRSPSFLSDQLIDMHIKRHKHATCAIS